MYRGERKSLRKLHFICPYVPEIDRAVSAKDIYAGASPVADSNLCRISLVVEWELAKFQTRVRFSYSAPILIVYVFVYKILRHLEDV
jgi:hypothetical protein